MRHEAESPKKLISDLLDTVPGIHHCFCTRQGGVSSGLYLSLNCGLGSTDSQTNVESNRTELEKTKKTLEGANRDIMDVRSTLTQQIARNKEELKMLRLKGERDFFEFDITKKQKFVSVGGIKFRLTRTKWKKGRYSVRMVVDDRNIERKSKFVNEPVQFLVGPTKLRYELVVNEVPEKDRIIGYLSVPKNKVHASERRN